MVGRLFMLLLFLLLAFSNTCCALSKKYRTASVCGLSPLFIGYMGDGVYSICWLNPYYDTPLVRYTTDFLKVTGTPPLLSTPFHPGGIPVSARREGSNIYLIGGQNIYTLAIGDA